VAKSANKGFTIKAADLRTVLQIKAGVTFRTLTDDNHVFFVLRNSLQEARVIFGAGEALTIKNETAPISSAIENAAHHDKVMHLCNGILKITSGGLSFTSEGHEFNFDRSEMRVSFEYMPNLYETLFHVEERSKAKTTFSVKESEGEAQLFDLIRGQLVRRGGFPKHITQRGSYNETLLW
jgi:hypothetical protein